MTWRDGGANPALRRILGASIAFLGASQSFAAQSLRCVFTQECPTGDACSDYDPQEVLFFRDDRSDGLWTLTSADDPDIPFTLLPFETDDLRAFVSTSADPGASAVSLLTVFSDGQAIMGIHGVFFAPGSVTHLGTCVPKDS
jgi:hypothetical protein